MVCNQMSRDPMSAIIFATIICRASIQNRRMFIFLKNVYSIGAASDGPECVVFLVSTHFV